MAENNVNIDIDLVDAVDVVEDVEEVRIPRRVLQRKNYFELYADKEFFERFRLSKESALEVLQQIEPEIEYLTDKNNSTSPVNQLLLTLRTYATGGHLLSVGDFIGADKSTVSRTVKRVTTAIARLLPNYIYMPRTNEEIVQHQNGFFGIAQFPRIIGAIDGTHVKILSPGGNDAEVFRNRKGFFSINVQAIGCSHLLFRDIVARWPGSTHDATIFNNSTVKQFFERGDYGNSVLLGDSVYMRRHYLLTPFLNPSTRGENLYNRAHIRTRVKVEHLFGIWKRRFPILAYGSRLKLETTLQIIVATAVLHNVARLRGEPELPPDPDVQQFLNNDVVHIIPDEHQRLDGVNVRRNLVATYFNR